MNTIITLALVGVVAILGIVTATDYCNKSLCQEWQGKHIGCGHSHQFAKSCANDAKLVQITSELKEYILKLHNDKRNTVAGGQAPNHRPACRMATMEWDDELAQLAELNVMQCKMQHDYCHNTQSIPVTGQNLAYKSYYDEPNYKELIQDAVQGWYDEIKGSNSKLVNKFPENYSGPIVLHFTGMMLEGNNRIGCAASTYSVNGQPYKIHLIACNMAGLTIPSEPVYRTCQKPATKCTSGKNSQYANLCSTSEKYN